MAAGDNYATPAELKSYISIADNVDDTEIGMALDSVSRAIEQFCNRQFNLDAAATARQYYADTLWYALVDDFYTTTDLVVATDDDADGVYETTWTTDEYELQPLNGIVGGVRGWPYHKVKAVTRSYPVCWVKRAPIQITARWGWTTVPEPVHQACLILAAEALKLKDSPFGVGGYGQFGIIRVRDNPMAARTLQPYVHQPVLVA